MKNDIIRDIEFMIISWGARYGLQNEYKRFLSLADEMPSAYYITGSDLLDFALWYRDEHKEELL